MRKNQGQAVLIVLLVVIVALGFGLSIISQSTTDVKIAGQSEESARAFNAAEAGIEDALKNVSLIVGGGSQNLTVDGINVNYQVSGENVLEGIYSANDPATVILGGADTLTIEWGDSCPGAASLEIMVIDNSGSTQKYGVNACDMVNGMATESQGGDNGYLKKFTLVVTANDRLVRIRPVYSQAKIRVIGASLPTQAYLIDSRAQSPTLEAKAIQVSRSVAALPAIFDYVLFSGTNIVK